MMMIMIMMISNSFKQAVKFREVNGGPPQLLLIHPVYCNMYTNPVSQTQWWLSGQTMRRVTVLGRQGRNAVM